MRHRAPDRRISPAGPPAGRRPACGALLACGVLVGCLSTPGAAGAAPPEPRRARADTTWNQFGGEARDNRSDDRGLLDHWPEEGPEHVAGRGDLGIGFSSVSFAPGVVLTLGTRGEEEMVFCLDAESLEERWATPIGRVRADGMGGGPRSTPTVDGDRVYALGAGGDLACLALDTGRLVWGGNILRVFAAENIVWGISESPLVDGDRVIVTPGGREATMAALDAKTGRTLWKGTVPGMPQAAYASAIVVTTGGVRQYVNFVHGGLVGIRAADGAVLWGDDSASNATANCSAPLAWKGDVFAASGYGAGGVLLRLARGRQGVRAVPAYTTKEMKNHHGGMVIDRDHLYGCDEGLLTCLELAGGRVAWQHRSVGKGAVVWADGKLVVRSEEGPVALVEATPRGYVELGRFTPAARSDRPAWAHPVIAAGRLWLRDQDRLDVYSVAE